MDKLIKAITKDGFLRVHAVETTETVNAAQNFTRFPRSVVPLLAG